MATSIIPNRNESLLQTQQYFDSETEAFATATSLNNREPRKVLKEGRMYFGTQHQQDSLKSYSQAPLNHGNLATHTFYSIYFFDWELTVLN